MLETCSIALVGKYTKFSDSYASVIKALEHSALAINHKLDIKVRRVVLVQLRHEQGGCLQSVDAVYLLYIFEAQNIFLGLKRFMVGPWLSENNRAFLGNNKGRNGQNRS